MLFYLKRYHCNLESLGTVATSASLMTSRIMMGCRFEAETLTSTPGRPAGNAKMKSNDQFRSASLPQESAKSRSPTCKPPHVANAGGSR